VTNTTRLTILVVDDDVDVVRALGRLLRGCGHVVHASFNSREGFELASRIKPDLILHDIAVPPFDGYEAARRLRNTTTLADTVLIACSGTIDESEARAAGFDGWLVKPISEGDIDAVLAIVSERVKQGAAKSKSDGN
jgi:two-component system cell cycle response regulator DivK